MNYTLTITALASAEIDAAVAWLLLRTEQHAPLWHARVLAAIDSLEQFPMRCPIAPENKRSSEEIRHLIVGDKIHGYRIIFAIRGDEVVILDFVHGARES